MDRTQRINFVQMILQAIGPTMPIFCKSYHGVAGYSEMARMLGLNDVADKYALIAQEMAMKWEKWQMKAITTVWL